MRRGFGGRVAAAVLVVSLAVIAGLLSYLLVGDSAPPSTAGGATSTAPPSPSSSTAGPSRGPAGEAPPGIPVTGAYLGAWVNPDRVTRGQQGNVGEPGSDEVAALPSFTATYGSSVAVYHVYAPFSDPLPTATLEAISAHNAVPLIDWSCADENAVTAGAYDRTITDYAESLKAYGKPVFLRWYWEMNIVSPMNKCGAATDPAGYVSAWRHLWHIFESVGASNVSFVWCPSSQAGASRWYPGNAYVNWIGVDGYDREGEGGAAVARVFGSFYREWSGAGKPLMIGETGAHAPEQAAFLQAIRTQLPTTYPDIKAVVYFDSAGPAGSWTLTGSGAAAFRALTQDPYFGYRGT